VAGSAVSKRGSNGTLPSQAPPSPNPQWLPQVSNVGR
jgi:hypothetical protein